MPPPQPSLSLSELFNASSLLLGTSTTTPPPPPKLTHPRPSFTSILSSRLSLLSTSYPSLATPFPLPTTQNGLESFTAQTALELLELIHSTLRNDNQNSKEGIPKFSVNQIKVIQTMGGIVARWGIANCFNQQERILPISLYNNKASETGVDKGKERFEEVDQEGEEERGTKLKEVVQRLMEKVLFNREGEGERDDEKQLRMIVMPQVLLPLLGSIIHLQSTDREEERGKWDNHLELLLNSYATLSLSYFSLRYQTQLTSIFLIVGIPSLFSSLTYSN